MKATALITTFLFLAVPVLAEDTMIRGTVVSVDRNNSRVILKVPDDNGDTSHEVVINVRDGWIPWGVRPGRMARAWGKPGKDGISFSATAVRPGRGADRTGIRGRLRKNCAGREHHMAAPPFSGGTPHIPSHSNKFQHSRSGRH